MASRVEELHLQADFLAAQFEQEGRTSARYIDEAIALDREALALGLPGQHKRGLSLAGLSCHLFTRYERFGAIRDIEEAIVLGREALQLYPRGHPLYLELLDRLGTYLSNRHNQLGAIRDLDEAIDLAQEALYLHLHGHPDRLLSLDSLAQHLSNRYDQLGVMADLDEAVVLGREAFQLCPQQHCMRSAISENLGTYLSNRYDQLGLMSDMDEAIILSDEALRLCPAGYLSRPVSLNNFANRLSKRYELLGMSQDLEAAIVLHRESLQLCPQGHPCRSTSLNNLAVCLSDRYHQLGAISDLDEAIELTREVLQLHPHRSNSLNNLGTYLFDRYDKLGTTQDLDEAIILGREALLFCSQGHPYRSSFLSTQATHLSARCSLPDTRPDSNVSRLDSSTSLSDQEELFSLYSQLATISYAVFSDDLAASRAWIYTAENFKHASTLLAYETSLRLLVEHLSLLPTLPEHFDILKDHTSSLAMDAFSACLRNGVPERAVELLEQGRGMFWNQLTRLRAPLDNVIASGAAGETLANEFVRLTSLIRKALDSPDVNQHGRACSLNLKMQQVVSAIRELPCLSRFLLPLLFADLRHAASGGPVIIVNASQYGCDALIIFEDRDPVHIPLSLTKGDVQRLSSTLGALTTQAKSGDVGKSLGRTLRELWDAVVFPVVRLLQESHPLQSRIWWCPTAEFCDLPLHAAGPYRKGQQNLAALYISSYTPTLGALVRARRPPSSDSDKKHFVGIGQASATGQSKLRSVGSELAHLGQLINGAATFTRIEGQDASISRVTEELQKNQWMHIACHGLANPTKPFKSAFALGEGHLTIERIIRCDLDDPEFAYLSACHTTVGYEKSPDEMIHLASAMQFVGFRSVIGTMWAVDDAETNKITLAFYRHMLDDSGRLDHIRAAFALNRTMQSVDVPLDQKVLYIHIGA